MTCPKCGRRFHLWDAELFNFLGADVTDDPTIRARLDAAKQKWITDRALAFTLKSLDVILTEFEEAFSDYFELEEPEELEV